MKDVMGVIYTSRNETTLRELTISRAVAALPVAGRYRMIDFMLSNMVNSGIRNVGVIMQKNYHSLMDHLGSGKEWDLHTRNDGLFILPPFLTRENTGAYSGLIDALRSNAAFLRRSHQEYLVLTSAHTVMNTKFDDMLAQHEETGADITLMYSRKEREEIDQTITLTPRHVFLDVDGDCVVKDIEIGIQKPSHDLFYMDLLLIKRTTLLQILDQAYAQGYQNMNRDILQRMIRTKQMHVCGYEFKGYNRRIETINSYFNMNMDLLEASIRRELFNVNPVYTKVRDEVPARYMGGAKAVNSLLADGCVVEGTVENSVLFRGVRVARGAVVRNSIVMQQSELRENVEIENVILDKKVTIKRDGRLIAPSNYPIVIGKGTTI